ncbi:hypothetical protein PHMEG_00019813 [Phytophthora megakarya]|uniref:Uncharacterized protein n=1 Tax=Phytophthora megakarya TaxID=4795 RepID=A0A225VQM0_9STRA|nr:hypothetical protein PHMEG_00019813 [Phytophthora megakarya]
MWNNDGPDTTVNSLSVVLDWFTTEGNYAKWRGETKQGQTKTILAVEICNVIKEKKIRAKRSPKGVITKVGKLENSYREAVDCLNNTGPGKTVEGSFKEWIERLCPHYDILKEIMDDRSTTSPLSTSEGPDFDEDDEFSNVGDSATTGDEASVDGDTVHKPEGFTSVSTSVSTSMFTSVSTGVSASASTSSSSSASSTSRVGSIRVRNARVASTLSEWGDINSTLTKAKDIDRENTQIMDEQKLAWEKE